MSRREHVDVALCAAGGGSGQDDSASLAAEVNAASVHNVEGIKRLDKEGKVKDKEAN